MPRVSAAQAVEVWERGLGGSLPQRAAMLAELASPALTSMQLEREGIGWRDLSILALRKETLGSPLACVVACRHCGARLEFTVDADEFVAPQDMPGAARDRYDLTVGEFRLTYRPPTGADVADVAARGAGETARRELLERCTLSVTRADGTAGRLEELAAPLLDALEAALEAQDPLASVSIATTCAACGRASEFGFDIVGFFWAELATTAKRLLSEVDVLARTYHWREADILALSAVRRRRYVEAAIL